MNKLDMTAKILASELLSALQDDEEAGFDHHEGSLGPNATDWVKKVAQIYILLDKLLDEQLQ